MKKKKAPRPLSSTEQFLNSLEQEQESLEIETSQKRVSFSENTEFIDSDDEEGFEAKRSKHVKEIKETFKGRFLPGNTL